MPAMKFCATLLVLAAALFSTVAPASADNFLEQFVAVQVENPQPLPLAIDDSFEFGKSKLLFVESDGSPETADKMVREEVRRIFYGAVTDLDRAARLGNYYTFFWKASRPANVTVRLEYRQAKYGDFVQAQELKYEGVKGKVISKFAVIGDSFKEGGQVTSWRCVIIEDGKVVALTHSYLWK